MPPARRDPALEAPLGIDGDRLPPLSAIATVSCIAAIGMKTRSGDARAILGRLAAGRLSDRRTSVRPVGRLGRTDFKAVLRSRGAGTGASLTIRVGKDDTYVVIRDDGVGDGVMALHCDALLPEPCPHDEGDALDWAVAIAARVGDGFLGALIGAGIMDLADDARDLTVARDGVACAEAQDALTVLAAAHEGVDVDALATIVLPSPWSGGLFEIDGREVPMASSETGRAVEARLLGAVGPALSISAIDRDGTSFRLHPTRYALGVERDPVAAMRILADWAAS